MVNRKVNFWTDKTLPFIMEYGIYLFVLLMFGGRFGTFREIGIYLPAFLWLFQGIKRGKFELAWREPLFISILALSLSATVASFSSTTPLNSLLLLKREYLKILLLYLVISTTFVKSERLKGLALFIAFVGIVYLISGFYRIFADLVKSGSINYDETRYYATVFLFFFPFFLLQNISTKGLKRVLWMIPLIGSAAGILLIGVRGSWLALFSILCIWIYFLKERSKNILTVLKIGLPAIIVVIIIVFIVFPGQLKMIKEHTIQKVQMSLRFETWNMFLTMSRERFFTGHGLDDTAMSGNFREFYKSVKGVYPLEGVQPTTPHNQFIKMLYQQGIVGLGLYIVLFILLVYGTVKKFFMSKLSDPSFIGIAIISTVIGEYVIRCMSEDRSLIPLGLLLGMAGAYLNPAEKNRDAEDG